MGQKQAIELLAPAKNYESGVAAINHGADAVYVAAQHFGAREAAGNPINDIERLAAYAHRYYAKTYLVLNTILYDNEIEPACKILHQAYEAGCDAAIIQDMGLLEADIPPIPLFASTQTHNYSVDKVKFLESVGFRRVILARELSVEQIAEIRSQTSVDLETFVHGALCVSYSGQCYMSCAITKRSANRGACAQMCRLPYDLVDDKGAVLVTQKHLLSLRDLNLSAHLAGLLHAGVTSLKIEGRLKDVAYVKNITALYRKELDALLNAQERYKKASSGSVRLNFTPKAERSFSRGFTTYFFNGRKEKIASLDSPKSVGQYAGMVVKKSKDSIVVDADVELHNGDGICFVDDRGEMQGTRVNKVAGNCLFLLSMEGIKVGTKLYRNYDHLFDKKLTLADSAIRQIAVDVRFYADGKNIRIAACDEDKVVAELNTDQCGELAQNAGMATQTLKEQFAKTGGTLFAFTVTEIKTNAAYFYPVAQINTWRRQLVELLEQARDKAYPKSMVVIEKNDVPYIETSLSYTTNVANSFAERFYRRHGVLHIERSFETHGASGAPVLMYNRYCIKYELGLCPTRQNAKPVGALYLVHKHHRFQLIFNCAVCQMQIVNANLQKA